MSPSAETPLEFPGNHGDINAVTSLHKFLLKIPKVHTLSFLSVIASVHTSSIPSVNLSGVECQKFQDELWGESLGITADTPIENYT